MQSVDAMTLSQVGMPCVSRCPYNWASADRASWCHEQVPPALSQAVPKDFIIFIGRDCSSTAPSL